MTVSAAAAVDPTDPVAFRAAVSEDIGRLGGAFYFVPETVAVGREHGLDGFRFYFLGRGGALGDVEADVVTSAFGYWNPALVAKIWPSARERADVTPREAGRIYLECAAEYGRRFFAELTGLDAFCTAAERVVAAVDRAALALFAAVAAEPLAGDPPGRAMQLLVRLREWRGSVHLVAVLASGLEPRVAHGIRRPAFWTTFGYDEADAPAGTAEERALLADADVLTDRLVSAPWSVLDDAERAACATAVAAMTAAVPADAFDNQ